MRLARRAWRARASGAAVAIATASVLLCTAAVIDRRVADPPLGTLLARMTQAQSGPRAPAGAARPALRAYIVLQPGDCDSRLAQASALGARSAAGKVDVRGLVVGAGRGLDSLRRRLSASDITLPLAAAPRNLADRLHAIGHATTPLLVVVDADDRLTYAAPLPRDDAERARLVALLPLLAAATGSP